MPFSLAAYPQSSRCIRRSRLQNSSHSDGSHSARGLAVRGRCPWYFAADRHRKTAAFVLPMLTMLEQGRARAASAAPSSSATRELAAQSPSTLRSMEAPQVFHFFSQRSADPCASFAQSDAKLLRGVDV